MGKNEAENQALFPAVSTARRRETCRSGTKVVIEQ
jgi:hypothetical protein